MHVPGRLNFWSVLGYITFYFIFNLYSGIFIFLCILIILNSIKNTQQFILNFDFGKTDNE